MTIRLTPELKKRLDKLAESTQRSKSYLATEAIREFIQLNEWQIAETVEGIREADQEDFASEAQLRAVLEKWGVDGD